MVKKNEYEPVSGVPRSAYLKAGFKEFPDYYSIRRYMYKKLTFLKLLIDKDGEFMATHMLGTDYEEYVPFWDDDFHRNNLVADEVTNNYNKFMDGLADQGIVRKVKKDGEN